MSDPATYQARYTEVLKRIEAAASDASVASGITLIAVSKKQSVDAIEALYRLGHRDFGENYVQELLEKANALKERGCNEIRWHFIGHLQSNKVKMLLPVVSVIHSVDSEKLANEISKRWMSSGRSGQLPVFLEVNVDQEESKSGILPKELGTVVSKISATPGLELRGLMCIPSPEGGLSGRSFRQLRALSQQLGSLTRGQLSMGMSQDFELAIREGATHVRVGTALFGERPS